jgi:hypothetical protein
MDKALLNSMTSAEQRLVAETSRAAMTDLDEDELLELQARIRRARSKYVTSYRRKASGAVAKRGGRGFSYPKNQRDRDKAEVFELALAQVSKEVSAHATRAAKELKDQRLTAARSGGSGPRVSAKTSSKGVQTTPATASKKRAASKTTGGVKRDASSKAAGARRQAKRDAT